MNAGYAFANITPTKAGVTLSGFAGRRNKPSEGVSDPLAVQALAIEEAGARVLLLVFDLLGLGEEMTAAIHDALDRFPGLDIPRAQRIFCCTHTHSAPVTVNLIGCGIEDHDYWAQVVSGAVEAAHSAVHSMRPARLRYGAAPVAGESFNRRKVLEDGRVTMIEFPDKVVVKEGPIWERFLLARLEDESGACIVGLAYWAAHACTVGEMRVSADYPGRLRELLADQYGFPCIFLQGASANINPPLGDQSHAHMMQNAAAVADKVRRHISWSAQVTPDPFALVTTTLRLAYGPVPSEDELIANILDIKPGDEPHPESMCYIGTLVTEWAEMIRTARVNRDGYDLAIQVWRLGPLVFCFVAAEVFVETAIAIQHAFPELLVNLVAYASPLVGYLPTDDALTEGGYEANHAYMFYRHPAAFAKGSEPALVDAMKQCIADTAHAAPSGRTALPLSLGL